MRLSSIGLWLTGVLSINYKMALDFNCNIVYQNIVKISVRFEIFIFRYCREQLLAPALSVIMVNISKKGGIAMKKRFTITLGVVVLLFSLVSAVIAETAPPADPKKHTEAGRYATAMEAYEMWRANPNKIKIIDCRIQEEYAFVGHPTMAYNIPSKLWTGKFNEEKRDYELKDNADFESHVQKKFAKDDTIMVMCRSGHRSAASVNRLTKAGFTNVYTIVDGFEGDKIKDEESYFNGKRVKNGWKNSTAPWTNDLNPELIYKP